MTSAGSTLPDKAVVSCVVRAFPRLSFPQPENGVAKVTYGIEFAPPPPKREPSDAPKPDPSAVPDPGAPPASDPPAHAEPGVVEGPWNGDAPKAGVCRSRAPKGHGCLATDGCVRGLVCLGHVCVEPAAGQVHDCQSDRDCTIWQRCDWASHAKGTAEFGGM